LAFLPRALDIQLQHAQQDHRNADNDRHHRRITDAGDHAEPRHHRREHAKNQCRRCYAKPPQRVRAMQMIAAYQKQDSAGE
jgi:hypothetical protein